MPELKIKNFVLPLHPYLRDLFFVNISLPLSLYMSWSEFCMIHVLCQLPDCLVWIFLTYRANSGISSQNKSIHFDWIYLVWLDSFCFAFLGWMTQRDFDILWMSGLRLIRTGIYVGYQDRNSSRLENFLDVETETHWDWEISWKLRPRLIKTG